MCGTTTNRCFVKACNVEGTEYRDFSMGGCGDIRRYCLRHVEEADKKQKTITFNRKRDYLRSVIKKQKKDLKDAIAALDEHMAKGVEVH